MHLNEFEDRPLPNSVRSASDWVVVVPLLGFCSIVMWLVSTWLDVPQEHLSRDRGPGDAAIVIQSITGLPDLSDEEDPQDTPGYIGPTPLVGVYSLAGVSKDRSGKWPTVRDAYFKEHPDCAFAGCKFKGPKQIHHLKPFHLHPELELDPDNLVTVCSGGEDDKGHPSPNHHLWVCHNGNFRDFNPRAKADLAAGRYPKKGAELFIKHEAKHGRTPPKTVLAP